VLTKDERRIVYYVRKVREVTAWPVGPRKERRVERLLAYKEQMNDRLRAVQNLGTP